MLLADAASTTQALSSGDKAVAALAVIGIIALILNSGGADRAQPASEEQIALWAYEAGTVLLQRSGPGEEPVFMGDHFDAQPYGSDPQERARVLAEFEKYAIPKQHNDTVCYTPNHLLLRRDIMDGINRITEKDFGHRINVGSIGNGSVTTIGANNTVAGVSATNQPSAISEQQLKVLEAVAKDLYPFALHVEGDEKPTAQRLLREVEEAARTKDGRALPGTIKQLKELITRLPATQPYIATITAAVTLLEAMGLHP